MTRNDSDGGGIQIRRRIKESEVELDGVMEDRRKTEAAVEQAKATMRDLLKRIREIDAKEGNLRKQIGDLRSVLKGISD